MTRIPKMTGLQFLVLALLFDGPKAGRELRRALDEHQAPMNKSSFSDLVRRLERRVACRHVARATGRHAVLRADPHDAANCRA